MILLFRKKEILFLRKKKILVLCKKKSPPFYAGFLLSIIELAEPKPSQFMMTKVVAQKAPGS